MFLRVIPDNRGESHTSFCDLVESYRDGNGVPRHRVVVKLGRIDNGRIPYLKAAFSRGKPEEILEHELRKK